MEGVHKGLADDDTITGIRKSERTVIVSIFTLISFEDKDANALI